MPVGASWVNGLPPAPAIHESSQPTRRNQSSIIRQNRHDTKIKIIRWVIMLYRTNVQTVCNLMSLPQRPAVRDS
jgi:hypothetical protein